MGLSEKDYQEMIKRCLRCSICKWIPQIQIKSQKYATTCPAIDQYNFHAYSGGGKIISALLLEMGRIKPSKELRDMVYKCTECGACAVSCKFLNDLEPLEIIMRLREKLVEEGYGPMPQQQQYIRAVEEKNNPYNEPHENRLNWLPDDIIVDHDAKILFYVGCTAAYRRNEMAIAAARILNLANIPFNIMEGEICCGSPILRTGDIKSFKQIVDTNLDMIERTEAETVIFCCAGCYSTFKVDYLLQRDYSFTTLHIVEFFNKLIDENKIKPTKTVPLKVTYHDPCHLGRNSERYENWHGEEVPVMPLVKVNVPPKPKRTGSKGIYESPRELIEKIPGVKLIEMERVREYSYCCGAGAGVKSAFPEFALNTSKSRIEEAEDTGAEALISACPFCYTNLHDGIVEADSPLKFYDIGELLLKSLDYSEKEKGSE